MRRYSIFLLLILSVLSVSSEDYIKHNLEPLEMAKRIFPKGRTMTLDDFIIDRQDCIFTGQKISDSLYYDFLLLEQTDDCAVVNVTIWSGLEADDFYVYFRKDNFWKYYTMRVWPKTIMLKELIKEMTQFSSEQIDQMIQDSIFRSREDFDQSLDNMKLTIALDDNIIHHFETHKVEFEHLKDLALTELSLIDANMDIEEVSVSLLKNQESLYKKLLLSSVSVRDYAISTNCLLFCIGGIMDNTVGYLYTQDKSQLPQMTPNSVIMLREIGDGWYMYKTT